MPRILQGSNRRVIVIFRKILLDIFKLDLLGSHGWTGIGKREKFFGGLISVAPNRIDYILSLKTTQFGAKNAILEPFICQFSLKYLTRSDIKRGHKAA